MQQENIRYVLVWSGWLRLTHWLIAASVLFLLGSAWVLKHGQALEQDEFAFWLDWHLIIGQLMLMVLALRVILLFFPGSSNWRAFVPGGEQLPAMIQMIKFYLSFARFPLPNWYAHNPLWLPVYPVVFLVLAGSGISGLLYNDSFRFLGQPMYTMHEALAGMISVFVLFHVVSVFLHDLKGKGAFISAMVNGYRYFHAPLADNKGKQSPHIQAVSVDSITKPPTDD